MASTRSRSDDGAGASFDCRLCRRPAECNLPAVDEDGHTPLAPSEVVDIYNERRFRHYLTDYHDAEALRDHLTERALYWTQGQPADERDAALATVGPCVEWWQIAHPAHAEARRAITKIEDLQVAAEAGKFAGLSVTQKFAVIRRQLESVSAGMDLSRFAGGKETPRRAEPEVHAYLMDQAGDLWEGEAWAAPARILS
jgi:crotonobetainyl-CoA:carnitine CoA-transferase CaiB-like acyl-CoA transferase